MTIGSSPEHHPADDKWTWEKKGWLWSAFWLLFLYNPASHTLSADVAPQWKVVSLTGVAVFSVLYICSFRFENAIRQKVGTKGQVVFLALLLIPALATVPAAGYVSLAFVPYFGAYSFVLLPYRYGFSVTILGALTIIATAWFLDKWILLWFLLWLTVAVIPSGLGRYMGERTSAQGLAVHRAVMAEDRDRMARDMHDVLGHTLTVLSVKAELAEKLITKDPERARAELRDVQSMTRQALAEVRSTIAGLRVARLEDEVEDAHQACRSSGIALEIANDPREVDPQHRITLAWVLREAITNVVRHSKATHVSVEWGSDWLEVTDNGLGLRGRKEGNGITGVRERVESVGGKLVIRSGDSTQNPGTTVRVQL